MDTDTAYYQRRAQQETASAASAAHPQARDVHLELARRYSGLAGGQGPIAYAK